MEYKYAPYSYSKISSYGSCPKAFKLGYIDKVKLDIPENDFFKRGHYIHDRLEHHDNPQKIIDSQGMDQDEIDKCENIYKEFADSELGDKYLKRECIGSEIEMALSTKLRICKFWDNDCLFRGKVDRLNKLSPTVYNAIDWKSGKYRAQGKQLKYYAAWCFLKYPELEKVVASFVFVESKRCYEEVYTKSHMKNIFGHLFKRIKRIEREVFFKGNASFGCEYCDFRKAKLCSPKL